MASRAAEAAMNALREALAVHVQTSSGTGLYLAVPVAGQAIHLLSRLHCDNQQQVCDERERHV
jgi:hypothetical protein